MENNPQEAPPIRESDNIFDWPEEKAIEHIKKYIAPVASKMDITYFLGTCKRFGLDPLKREAHLIVSGSRPPLVIVGYHVYIARAAASGLLRGWTIDTVDAGEPTERARLIIHREGWITPFVWETYPKEASTGSPMWSKMPRFFNKKVCISQGFRACFADLFGGLPYTREEMEKEG